MIGFLSALEVMLEKVGSLISEFQSLKLEMNSLNKPEYPYLRAALRNRTDSTATIAIQRSPYLNAIKTWLLTGGLKTENQKCKTSANINNQTTINAKRDRKGGRFTLVV